MRMSRTPSARNKKGFKTHQALLLLLKQQGAMESAALARRLGITPMAVRKHLYELQKQKLVHYQEQPRPMGRPVKLWGLTPASDRFFPSGYADLTVSLIETFRKTFGQGALLKVIRSRGRDQVRNYQSRLGHKETLAGRVRLLAQVRTEEGYMAEARAEKDGSYLLIENHCPICAAARACQGFCDAEQEVFQQLLGPGVALTRTEHIQAGARRCVYRISPSGGNRQSISPQDAKIDKRKTGFQDACTGKENQ